MASNTDLNAATSSGDKIVTKERTHDGDSAKQQGVFLSGVSGSEGAYTFVDVQAGAGTAAAALRTTLASDDPAVASLQVLDDWDESDRAKVNPIAGQAGVAAGAGAVDALTQRVTLASDDPAVAALQALDNAIAGNEMQVDVVSSALPSGAATAAKQPALGTAGAASADVITVQGVASMTPLQVGDNAGSLTVDAPVGTPVFVRLSDGSSAITTLPVSLASVPSHAVTNAGTFATQVTSLPASTNTIEVVGDAAENAAAAGNPVMVGGRYDSSARTLGNGDVGAVAVNASGQLLVEIAAGAGSGGTSAADGATFTRNTTSVTPVGAVVETSAPTLNNGDVAGLSQDTAGNLRVRLEAGGVSGIAEDSASAGGEEGVAMLAVRRDAASSGVSADGDFAFLSVTSDGSLRVSGSSGTTQYAEDAAHTTGDQLCVVGAVRRDTAAVGSGTDGDYSTLNVNSSGRLYTSTTIDAALPAGTNNIGDVDIASIAAGDNNIGNVDVVTVPADPFGANADAASATGSISAKLRFIASTGIPITGTVTVGSHAVTNAGTFATQVTSLPASTNTIEVVGDAAHDAAIAGNPVRMAGRALTSDYTAVAAGDTADLVTTLLGKLVTIPYANPANTWSYASAAAVTDTADDEAKAAGAAGVRHYITGVQVFNGHDTTGTEVVIKDGSTVLWRGWAEQTGGGCSARFDPPLRGTAATAVNVANITTSSSTYFNLQGFSAAE